jgi:hypothetical protein
VLKPGQKISLFGGAVTIRRREKFDPQAVKDNLWWTIPFGILLLLWAIFPLLPKFFHGN